MDQKDTVDYVITHIGNASNPKEFPNSLEPYYLSLGDPQRKYYESYLQLFSQLYLNKRDTEKETHKSEGRHRWALFLIRIVQYYEFNIATVLSLNTRIIHLDGWVSEMHRVIKEKKGVNLLQAIDWEKQYHIASMRNRNAVPLIPTVNPDGEYASDFMHNKNEDREDNTSKPVNNGGNGWSKFFYGNNSNVKKEEPVYSNYATNTDPAQLARVHELEKQVKEYEEQLRKALKERDEAVVELRGKERESKAEIESLQQAIKTLVAKKNVLEQTIKELETKKGGADDSIVQTLHLLISNDYRNKSDKDLERISKALQERVTNEQDNINNSEGADKFRAEHNRLTLSNPYPIDPRTLERTIYDPELKRQVPNLDYPKDMKEAVKAYRKKQLHMKQVVEVELTKLESRFKDALTPDGIVAANGRITTYNKEIDLINKVLEGRRVNGPVPVVKKTEAPAADNNEVKKLTDDIAKYKADIEEYKKKQDEAIQSISDLNATIDDDKLKYAELKAEHDRIKQQLDTITRERDELQLKVEEKIVQINQLTDNVEKQRQTVEELQSFINTKTELIRELEEQAAEATDSAEVTKLRTDLITATAQVESYKTLHDTAQKSVEELQQQLHNMPTYSDLTLVMDMYEKLEAEKQLIEDQMNELRDGKLADINKEIEEKTTERKRLNNLINTETDASRIAVLQSQLDEIIIKINNLEIEKSTLNNTVDKQQHEIDTLRNVIAASRDAREKMAQHMGESIEESVNIHVARERSKIYTKLLNELSRNETIKNKLNDIIDDNPEGKLDQLMNQLARMKLNNGTAPAAAPRFIYSTYHNALAQKIPYWIPTV